MKTLVSIMFAVAIVLLSNCGVSCPSDAKVVFNNGGSMGPYHCECDDDDKKIVTVDGAKWCVYSAYVNTNYDMSISMSQFDMTQPSDLKDPSVHDVSKAAGATAWAVSTKLGLIKPSSACGTYGLTVCNTATMIDLSKCGALGGFFISNNWGYRPKAAPGIPGCDGSGTMTDPYSIWGCGSLSTGITQIGGCHGFSLNLVPDGNGWQSVNNPDPDGVQTQNPANGVLCCSP